MRLTDEQKRELRNAAERDTEYAEHYGDAAESGREVPAQTILALLDEVEELRANYKPATENAGVTKKSDYEPLCTCGCPKSFHEFGKGRCGTSECIGGGDDCKSYAARVRHGMGG